MKKNIFLFGMIFLSSFYLKAQQPADAQKNYKWQVGFQLNTTRKDLPGEYTYVNTMQSTFSNSPEYNLVGGWSSNAKTKDKSFAIALFGNYFIRNKTFIRAKINLNKINVEIPDDEFSDTAFHIYYTASKKRNDINSAIGLGYLIQLKKIDFYFGVEIPGIFYGKEKLYDYYEVDDINTNAFIYSGETEASFNNGYSIGLGNFVGAALALKHFSLGSEIGYSFLFSKYGGNGTYEHINKYPSQTPTYINFTHNPSLSLFEFSKINVSFNLAYNF
jgi:hypothetical protein